MPIIVGPVRISYFHGYKYVCLGHNLKFTANDWLPSCPKHFFLYSNGKLDKQSGSRGEWT